MRMVAKTCEFCSQTFYVRLYREKKARFCSRSCRGKWLVKFRGFGTNTRFKTPAGRKEYLEKHGWKVVILYDNFTEEEMLKEVLKYCPVQRILLGGGLR